MGLLTGPTGDRRPGDEEHDQTGGSVEELVVRQGSEKGGHVQGLTVDQDHPAEHVAETDQ